MKGVWAAAAASVQGQGGDLAHKGEGSATGVVIPGAQCYPPKKHKALAENRQKEGTKHCPWHQGLLPLWEAFPGHAPICATHCNASSQHPHLGDVRGEAEPQLGLGSGGAAANTALFPQNYPQAAHGQTFRYTWGPGHTWLVSLAGRV